MDAACTVACSEGLASVTVGKVGASAGVSTALVHYHFDTKQRLLVAAADRLAMRRREARTSGLSRGSGLAALDGLWEALSSGASAGAERAWLELVFSAAGDAGLREVVSAQRTAMRAGLAAQLPVLLAGLQTRAAVAVDELASVVDAALDGFGAALAGGESPDVVRAAYDAFWLTVVAAAPPGRRR